MTQIKLQQFEGPLDLLLTLIEQQELDITQISLAQVTEQFLGYVKRLEEIDATELADYLTIAAKLLVIKSKAILPSLEVETIEEEPEEDLATRLLRYKQFKEAAKYFKDLDSRGAQSFTRTRVFSERIHFFPDPAVDAPALRTAISAVVDALKELDNLPKAKVREAISIQEKISALQLHLSSQIETKMSDLIANAKNKEEVIITFLALLELIKQRMFTVDQDALFTDITIKKYVAPAIMEDPMEESEDLASSLEESVIDPATEGESEQELAVVPENELNESDDDDHDDEDEELDDEEDYDDEDDEDDED